MSAGSGTRTSRVADSDALAAVLAALLMTRADGPSETPLQRWRRTRIDAHRLSHKESLGFAAQR